MVFLNRFVLRHSDLVPRYYQYNSMICGQRCVTFLTHTMSSMFYVVSHTVKFLVPGLLFLYKKQYKTCTRVLKKFQKKKKQGGLLPRACLFLQYMVIVIIIIYNSNNSVIFIFFLYKTYSNVNYTPPAYYNTLFLQYI